MNTGGKRIYIWMQAAFSEAAKGLGDTSPNPAVGAVIVRGGKIVARGYHRRYGGAHAEIEAIADARRRGVSTRGATMAVTLEPCDHFGKTPPCTRAILSAGIKRVVVGMLDPHAIVSGKGARRLRRAGVRVDVLDDPAAREFYAPYRTYHEQKRCHVTLKLAISTDGKISGGAGRWITGQAARAEVQRIRRKVDAILIGRRTAEIDNPRLTIRPAFAAGRRRMPVRVILSASGKVSRRLRIFHDKRAPSWIITERDIRKLTGDLARRGIVHLLVEGGAMTARSFLKSGVVDDIQLFVSPKILGEKALDGFGRMKLVSPIQKSWLLTRAKKFGPDMLLSFK